MSEDNVVQTQAPDELVGVLPRTLGIRPLRKRNEMGDVISEVSGVYGGNAANVWVASFADEPEAQAFILASNYMGQIVRGIVIQDIAMVATPEALDGSGKARGELTGWSG